jgi:uncharacterized membrane protein YqjE
MTGGESNPPGMADLLRRAARTALGALQNRGELFLVELEEEKNRAIELCIWGAAVVVMGMMFLMIFTATIILLFRDDLRIYAAGGFCLLYFVGALFALRNAKALWKSSPSPFANTIGEVKKDCECLGLSK